MKRFTLIFSLLVAIATTAMSQFTLTYNQYNDGFWGQTALRPVSYDGNVYMHEVPVKVTSEGNVTVTISHVDGTGVHGLNILAVDLVDSEGTAASFDYHVGFAGGTPNGNVYTLQSVPVGRYFLRCFVCDKGADQVTLAGGTIVVTNAAKNYVEVSPSTGTLKKGTSTGQTWNDTWTSTSSIALMLSIASNTGQQNYNMQSANFSTTDYKCLDVRGGLPSDATSSSTYTLTAPFGYYIAGYSFNYRKVATADYAATITMGEDVITATNALQHHSQSVEAQSSVSFVVKDCNSGILLSSFYVYLVPQFENTLYTLQSVHKSGNYLYADDANKLMFGTTVNSRSVWMFTESGDGYLMRNIHTDSYVPALPTTANNTSNDMYLNLVPVADAGTLNITQGSNAIIIGNGVNGLHSNDGSSNQVRVWEGTGVGNQYTFLEVNDFSHTLSVTDAGWATLCLGFNATIPEGVEVYAVTGVKENNWLEMTQITGVLPANTGVLVKAAQGNYDFAYTTESATINGNKLAGALYNKSVTAEAYVLANGANGIGLYPVQTSNGAFACKANCAYLPASEVPEGASLSSSFRFDFGGTTAVEKVESRNEKEEIYDLQGRRINEITQPGIYVVNGVKRVVK